MRPKLKSRTSNYRQLSRRSFLTAGVTALTRAAGPKMKLSLSARVAESFTSKEKTTLAFDDFINLAKTTGYEAVCMRASQGGIQTPKDRLRQMSRAVDDAGLKVSMVTGDFAVPSNNEDGPKCLRHITPYLDLADTFGAGLIRICMKKEEDIAWAQRASDEARERGIRLAHQSHDASLFETVDGAIDVLKKVGRSNFGLIYEPANWMISQQDYGPKTIRRIQPWLMNVYLQNHLLTPNGKASVETWTRGRVPLDHIGLWEKGGVDLDQVFAGLHAIGYSGYVTVHQAFAEIMTPQEAAVRSYQYLKPFTG
ncbi:MAG: sugar phosphate isomerase/epimerase [Acidobacteria bacterium]|nr:sugar phosphate isomerase/epimerase [Acidobacteriota bacterium]